MSRTDILPRISFIPSLVSLIATAIMKDLSSEYSFIFLILGKTKFIVNKDTHLNDKSIDDQQCENNEEANSCSGINQHNHSQYHSD